MRRQVVADMFGMALRSYQRKMQRLTEGATQRDRTLWEAVLDCVATEQPTKGRVLERFSRDGEKEVISVLSDLVRSGLVFTTGSGRGAIYGATQDELRQAVLRDHDQESLENWLWLKAFRLEVTTVQEAYAALPSVEASLVAAALEELIATGRLLREGDHLSSSNLVIPMGTEQGWETAVLDHFRTVAVAIAKKVGGGFTPSSASDEIGGSTFTYTVSPGLVFWEPYADESYGQYPCLPFPLPVTTNENGATLAECRAFEVLEGSSQGCDAPGRTAVSAQEFGVVQKWVLDGHFFCKAADCSADVTVCEIEQLVDGPEGVSSCLNDEEATGDGWCYIDAAQGTGNDELVEECPAAYPHRVRGVGSALNTMKFLYCLGSP